jgi:DNA primase
MLTNAYQTDSFFSKTQPIKEILYMKPNQTVGTKIDSPLGEPGGSFDGSERELLRYSTQKLVIHVLGGVRLSGFDRLRVTLKVFSTKGETALPLRLGMDLYNSDQVEKWIRRVSEQFQMELKEVRVIVMGLIDALEKYRVDELKALEDIKPRTKVLSEEEQREAEEYLRQADLMGRMGEDLGRSGIIGEQVNRMLMLLAFTSRLLNQPLSVLTLGLSGVGKTYLQSRTALLIPEEDRVEVTSLSKTAMYYFTEEELSRKVVLIEDLDGASPDAMYSVRELISKQQLTKLIVERDLYGRMKTKKVVLRAKVSVASTSTKDMVYEDNSNRSLLLFPDSSKAQDQRIMAYQQDRKAGLIDTDEEQRIQSLLQNVQRVLGRTDVRVLNPFAPLLSLPDTIYVPRRAMNIYLSLIETITFMHCFQRKPNKQGFIETTTEDIQLANQLIAEVFMQKSDTVSQGARNVLESLKKHLEQEKRSVFVTKDVVHELKINSSNLKRYLKEWISADLVRLQEGSNRYRGNEYRLLSDTEYSRMRQGVADSLNNQLAKPRNKGKSSGPVVQSGPK